MTSLLETCRPIFAMTRGDTPEVVIHGVVYFAINRKVVFGHDPDTRIVARSLLKPWQFIAMDVDGDENYWAMGLSSHSGQPMHMEQLEELSKAAQAGEAELFCPRGFPLDAQESAKLKISGGHPTRMHHPCSGKHLVMLAACQKNGYEKGNYWDTNHPVQERVQNLVGQHIGEKPDWVTDSCGLPTISASARSQITLWDRLAREDDPRFVRMRSLWTKNPMLVGGANRLDSTISEKSEGRILSKEGADGLLLLQSLPDDNDETATCLIKLVSGYSAAHLALGLWSVLSTVDQLPASFEMIKEFLRKNLERWVPSDQKLVNCLKP